MRHAIIVVGSEEQRALPVPEVKLRDDEAVRTSTWFACSNQDDPSLLLDERGVLTRLVLAPILFYKFYLLVHNTKLWAGKRPLLLLRGRSLASRIAAYAGSWGGGDVVKADQTDASALGPTRFVLDADGNLKLHAD
ncbi:MAG: hypothetical protein QNJ11_10015 [Woeseiaceae bacterium]|nr:hypothetical protein [Woeseiaceae bacterium]